MNGLQKFFESYVAAALWSSNDESRPDGGDPLDKNYGIEDLHKSCKEKMLKDCTKFLQNNAEDIDDKFDQAGHDFWLTRNGHGAGFWDGDWPEPQASRLTKACEEFGEIHLFVITKKVHQG